MQNDNTTNNKIMVKSTKKCVGEFPTVVNKINESGITYKNEPLAYATMDNKFAKSRIGIGYSSATNIIGIFKNLINLVYVLKLL